MGAKLRIVRRRIRSVQSTMKITRAMELIAASRIVRAQQRVEAARPYAELLTRAMEDVAAQTGGLVHPLLEEREDPRAGGVFVVTSDRGLAGSYNSNVLRLTEQRIAEKLIEDFASRRIDELTAVYTDFRSAFTLRQTAKRFLPLAPEEVAPTQREARAEYLFEPEPAEILDELLPAYVVTKVFAALLESAASENAARRRAMKAATDNAEELMKVLTRQANRARQDEITTEIMEIVGGAEALAAKSAEE